MEDVVRQSQNYASTLQTYNTSLQSDVQVKWGATLRITLNLRRAEMVFA